MVGWSTGWDETEQVEQTPDLNQKGQRKASLAEMAGGIPGELLAKLWKMEIQSQKTEIRDRVIRPWGKDSQMRDEAERGDSVIHLTRRGPG